MNRRALLTGLAAASALPLVNIRRARSGPLMGFKAHLNGISQPNCPTLAYTPVIMRAAPINDGGSYDLVHNWWKPPAAGLVVMNANVWIQAHARPPSTIPGDGFEQCAKIHVSRDNGVSWQQLEASPGWEPAGYTNTGASQVSGCEDEADGTTLYQLRMYTTSDTGGNDCVIDGNPAHTWFTGYWGT